MTEHSWEFKGTHNGASLSGPVGEWWCPVCKTIALTDGRYEPYLEPQAPTVDNCRGLEIDCDMQVTINIMES